MRRLVVLVLGFIASVGIAAGAQAQQLENTYQDWSVYTITQGERKVCYVASSPVDKKGNYRKRAEPYFLVTSINGAVDEVSTSSGYPYKKESEVNVEVDGTKYKLFTKEELAWAYDTPQDTNMVKDMKTGKKMVVKGGSQVGTHSTDTYSLKGFTEAYKNMKKLCSN